MNRIPDSDGYSRAVDRQIGRSTAGKGGCGPCHQIGVRPGFLGIRSVEYRIRRSSRHGTDISIVRCGGPTSRFVDPTVGDDQFTTMAGVYATKDSDLGIGGPMAYLNEHIRRDRSLVWSSLSVLKQAARSRTRVARLAVTAALAIVLFLNFAAPARALVGAVLSGTNVPPTDALGGDPGWSSVTDGASRNAVYLGDGWVLSARHTGPNTGDIPAFQKEVFSTGTFDVIRASQNGVIQNQNFVVPNPTVDPFTQAPLSLSAQTDLRLGPNQR